jgi:hypothetical protein
MNILIEPPIAPKGIPFPQDLEAKVLEKKSCPTIVKDMFVHLLSHPMAKKKIST